MASIQFDERQLAARFASDAAGFEKALHLGILAGAHRGRALMVSRSPVDRGILRNAWRVIKASGFVTLQNDQPYAGVLERGARPFRISSEGLAALRGWVLRAFRSGKLVPDNKSTLDAQATKIARAIAKKFEKVGKKGKFFVRDSVDTLRDLMAKEVDRTMKKFFDRPRSGGVNAKP